MLEEAQQNSTAGILEGRAGSPPPTSLPVTRGTTHIQQLSANSENSQVVLVLLEPLAQAHTVVVVPGRLFLNSQAGPQASDLPHHPSPDLPRHRVTLTLASCCEIGTAHGLSAKPCLCFNKGSLAKSYSVGLKTPCLILVYFLS